MSNLPQRFLRRNTLLVLVISIFAMSNHTIASAEKTGSESKQLDVGDKAIDFELPIVGEDDYVQLKTEYDEGPVVVVVLRGFPGYQCPLCRQQVGAMINRGRTLKANAHKVILVYPGSASDLEQNAGKFMSSRKIPEPMVLVRDPDMKMVDSWGLRWKAPRETAYPATYIIKSNGRVAWKKVSNSHAGRSSVEEILKELKKL